MKWYTEYLWAVLVADRARRRYGKGFPVVAHDGMFCVISPKFVVEN